MYGVNLGFCMGDFIFLLRDGVVDVFIFNLLYVLIFEMFEWLESFKYDVLGIMGNLFFEDDLYFLVLFYVGGRDGMEIIDRLLEVLFMMLL